MVVDPVDQGEAVVAASAFFQGGSAADQRGYGIDCSKCCLPDMGGISTGVFSEKIHIDQSAHLRIGLVADLLRAAAVGERGQEGCDYLRRVAGSTVDLHTVLDLRVWRAGIFYRQAAASVYPVAQCGQVVVAGRRARGEAVLRRPHNIGSVIVDDGVGSSTGTRETALVSDLKGYGEGHGAAARYCSRGVVGVAGNAGRVSRTETGHLRCQPSRISRAGLCTGSGTVLRAGNNHWRKGIHMNYNRLGEYTGVTRIVRCQPGSRKAAAGTKRRRWAWGVINGQGSAATVRGGQVGCCRYLTDGGILDIGGRAGSKDHRSSSVNKTDKKLKGGGMPLVIRYHPEEMRNLVVVPLIRELKHGLQGIKF